MIRRAFLGSALAAASAVVVGAAAHEDVLAANLALLCPDLESACAVGHRHLARADADRDVPTLVRQFAAEGLMLDQPLADAEDARRILTNLIRRDFGAGRIVRVDGWLLAASEVRLCVLAALVT